MRIVPECDVGQMSGEQRVHAGGGADDAHVRLQHAGAERARTYARDPHARHPPPALLALQGPAHLRTDAMFSNAFSNINISNIKKNGK